MERRFIKERQREGIEQAKVDGRYAGGKRRLDRGQVLLLTEEGLGASDVAKRMGCSRMQVYRILAEVK
jgi:DNA invertase Pin-like site-specific DNA recombinase